MGNAMPAPTDGTPRPAIAMSDYCLLDVLIMTARMIMRDDAYMPHIACRRVCDLMRVSRQWRRVASHPLVWREMTVVAYSGRMPAGYTRASDALVLHSNIDWEADILAPRSVAEMLLKSHRSLKRIRVNASWFRLTGAAVMKSFVSWIPPGLVEIDVRVPLRPHVAARLLRTSGCQTLRRVRLVVLDQIASQTELNLVLRDPACVGRLEELHTHFMPRFAWLRDAIVDSGMLVTLRALGMHGNEHNMRDAIDIAQMAPRLTKLDVGMTLDRAAADRLALSGGRLAKLQLVAPPGLFEAGMTDIPTLTSVFRYSTPQSVSLVIELCQSLSALAELDVCANFSSTDILAIAASSAAKQLRRLRIGLRVATAGNLIALSELPSIVDLHILFDSANPVDDSTVSRHAGYGWNDDSSEVLDLFFLSRARTLRRVWLDGPRLGATMDIFGLYPLAQQLTHIGLVSRVPYGNPNRICATLLASPSLTTICTNQLLHLHASPRRHHHPDPQTVMQKRPACLEHIYAHSDCVLRGLACPHVHFSCIAGYPKNIFF